MVRQKPRKALAIAQNTGPVVASTVDHPSPSKIVDYRGGWEGLLYYGENDVVPVTRKN